MSDIVLYLSSERALYDIRTDEDSASNVSDLCNGSTTPDSCKVIMILSFNIAPRNFMQTCGA